MNKRKLFLIITLLLASFTIFGSASVSAEGNDQIEISISPVSHKLELEQGETYTGNVIVANTGKKEFDYEISVRPYGVADSSYSNVTFEANKYTDIVNWITFDQESGHLLPNESNTIKFTIAVPEKAVSIGQYLVIAASAVDQVPEEQSGLNVTGSVGSVVYATIAGDAKNSGEITENDFPSFYFNGPVTFNSTVKNTGDVHNTATYTIEIRNFFNNNVVFENAEEPITHIILPDTERFESNTWEAPMLGVFRAKQTIEYAGQTSIKEGIIIVCPAWFIFVSIFVIISITLRIILAIKKYRENKL